MSIDLHQFEMIAVITSLTQLLKMFVLDCLPLRWGHKNKVTVLLVFTASAVVLWLNNPNMPIRFFVQAVLFYGLAAMGGHSALKGSSRVLKKSERF